MPIVPNPSVAPYNTIALLRISLNTGEVGWGSGAVIDNAHILTCAHNLISRQGTYHATGITAFPGYSSPNTPDPTAGVAATHGFYPAPFVDQQDRTWDIGVVRLASKVSLPMYMTPFPVTEEPDKELDIAGYPSDHHFEMWENKEIWSGINIKEHIFSYVHETEAGSSGSPIFKFHGQRYLQYGVHSGLAKNLEDKVGVLMTGLTTSFVAFALQATVPTQPFLVKVSPQPW